MTERIGQPMSSGAGGAEPNGGGEPAPPSTGFSPLRLRQERYYYLRPAGVEASGYVPWPSHERRNQFFRALDDANRETFKETEERRAKLPRNAEGGVDMRAAIEQGIFSLVFVESPEQRARYVDITAHLCNGSPTKAQLKKLPDEVFDAFFGWIIEITTPKTSGLPGMQSGGAGGGSTT